MTLDTAVFLLPEVILILVATLIYVAGPFTNGRGPWVGLGVAALLFASLFLVEARPGELTSTAWRDPLGTYLRWLALPVGGLFLLAAGRSAQGPHGAEIVGSLVLVVAGLMLTAVAQDLVLFFVALELISIPTYVLLMLGRRDPTGQEAATKYFLLSVFSSAVLLYGFSFLYGIGGSTRLDVLADRLSQPEAAGLRPLAIVALVLIFAGLAFRLTAVPFHFYAPDVYEGTTQLNAGVLSVIPKLAGLVVVVRLLVMALPGIASYGWMLSLALALATMTVGNVLALWQNNIRRLLAYSSIAHGGYTLMGLTVAFAAAGGAEVPAATNGAGAALFYLSVYALATIAAFAALESLGSAERSVDRVDDLAGVARNHPLAAASIAIAMFSLAGIPPLAGFWGKFALLTGTMSARSGAVEARLEPWFLALAIVAVLNAAVAAAYYLRLIAVMYFRPAEGAPLPAAAAGGPRLAMVLATLGVLWLGAFPGPLMRAAGQAAPAGPRLEEAPRIESETIRAEWSPEPAGQDATGKTSRIRFAPPGADTSPARG